MDEESIEKEVQKELDAISLSGSDNEEIEDIAEYQLIPYDGDSMQLYLEKSLQRNQVAQDILKEASDILSVCDNVRKSLVLSEDIASKEENDEVLENENYPSTYILHLNKNDEIPTRSINELEEENKVKLEELEEIHKVKEEDEILQLEKKRILDKEALHRWEERESKLQKNISVMVDKANYWEKTYGEVAQEELSKKEFELEQEFLESQKKIEKMQEEEKKILETLLKEKEELDKIKRQDSAKCIQAVFRGYIARKKFGSELKTRISQAKESRRQERINEIERVRAEEKAKQEEERRERETKRRIEEERRKEEIDKIKEEEERKKQEVLKNDSHKRNETSIQPCTGAKGCPSPSAGNVISASVTNSLKISKTSSEDITTPENSCVDAIENTDQIEKSPHLNVRNALHESEKVYTILDSSKHNLSTSQKTTEQSGEMTNIGNEETVACFENTIAEKNDLTAIPEDEMLKLVSAKSVSDSIKLQNVLIESDNPKVNVHSHKLQIAVNVNPDCKKVVSATDAGTKSTLSELDIGENSNKPENIVEPPFTSAINSSKEDVTKMLDTPAENLLPEHFENFNPAFSTNSTSDKPRKVTEKLEEIWKQVESTERTEIDDSFQNQNFEQFPDINIAKNRIEKQDDNNCERIVGTETKPHSSGQGLSDLTLEKSHLNHETLNLKPMEEDTKNNTSFTKIKESELSLNSTKTSRCHIPSEAEFIPASSTHNIKSGSLISAQVMLPPEKKSVTHNVCNSTNSLNERDDEEGVVTKSKSRGNISPPVTHLYPILQEDNTNNMHTETIAKTSESSVEEFSYLDKLESRRKSWLEKLSSKVKREHKSSSSVARRRRLVRISSAAKKLPHFSQDEIFDGAYLTTECRIDKKSLSLEETKCVLLSNIEGGRNLSSLTNCAYLTHLTVQHCGLVDLENMQSCPCLKFINVSQNSINMISCGGMKQLEYLDVSYNCLTSIHGVEGCNSLLHLDLSHNNITKITGLEDATSLLHLRMCNNQLINISGLHCCENLLYLDVSENHLTNLDDLQECKLLLVVTASGNNLECVGQKFLENMVLLSKLDVSRNNLHGLDLSEYTWLPFLTELDASINRIGSSTESEFKPEFSILSPFISDLNLSKNVLSNPQDLASLTRCKCLHKVDLTDNPLISDVESDDFLRLIPEIVTKSENIELNLSENSIFENNLHLFCPLHNFGKTFVNLTHEVSGDEELINQNTHGSVVHIVSKQLEELKLEVKKYSSKIQKSSIRWGNRKVDGNNDSGIIPPQLFNNHVEHLKKLHRIVGYFRNVHEQEGFKFVPPPSTNTENVNTSLLSNQTTNKSEALPSENDATKSSNEVQISGIMPKPSVPEKTKKVEEVNSEQINSPLQGLLSENRPFSDNVVRSSTVYEKLKQKSESGVLENLAAKKIQSYWRGHHVRKRHSSIKNLRTEAAVKIQATWRGYITRMKIEKAMILLEQSSMNTPRHDDFEEEIDLDGFNFDEESFDQQWAYKVSGFDDLHPKAEDLMTQKINPAFHRASKFRNINDVPTKEYAHPDLTYAKPPLPPITSKGHTTLDTQLRLAELESNAPSVTDSNRTKQSAKQELLTNQWGIKSSSTSDLMMKRARRLKGGKKKMQTADEKLHRFQEITSMFQPSDQISHRRQHTPANKIDYFKAREQGYSVKNQKNMEEEEQKRQYTYEWLHSQVGSNYNPHHKISPPRKLGQPHPPETRRTQSSGFLPIIPKSPSLVGVQDLEVVSLTSGSSYMSRSKERLREIVKRHNPGRQQT